MKVQILLSTYNGMKFLPELLESLFRQKLDDSIVLEIIARDDGSSDGTAAYLEDVALSRAQLKVYRAQNLGVIASFFELIKLSSPDADILMFGDQDDVWIPEKVQRSVESVRKFQNTPAFYFSRLQYVDSRLKPLGQSFVPKRISFESALVENVATGCSVAFNAALRDLVLSVKNPPPKCLMHDWWLYLLAQGMGEVVYDERANVLYRQHGHNVVGASKSFWQIYKTKWQRFWSRGAKAPHVSDQAQSFLDLYRPKLDISKIKTIENFVNSKQNIFTRLVYALNLPTKRQSNLDNIIFRILIVLGRY